MPSIKHVIKQVGLLLLLSVGVVAAQDVSCPALSNAAIAETRSACQDMTEGQACYGSPPVSAEISGADVLFDSPGAKAPLESVQDLATVRTSEGVGMATLRTIAYPLDRWNPGNITMILMGDAIIRQDERDAYGLNTLTTTVTDSAGANVRSGPGTDYEAFDVLQTNEFVKLTGRVRSDNWLRLQLPDGTTGWISSQVVNQELVLSELPVVSVSSPEPQLLFSLYSIFGLETSTRDAPCAEAPESGVLLQTESRDNPLRLRVNQRDIIVAGTVFLQSQPDDQLTLYVIEGRASIDETTADEGYQINVPLELTEIGEDLPPAEQQPYDFDRMAPLPTWLLPRYVYIGLDEQLLITPRPQPDRSPLANILVDEPCVVTTGETGANLRAGPGTDFPIRGVLAYRETVRPDARAIGSDGGTWWRIAQNLWLSAATTVTGGDCVNVPQSERVPVPPTPQITPTAAG
jgi:uncharacterized protein YraI